MTTPTMTQRLLLWDSGDGLFTLSKAADKEDRSFTNSSALTYLTALLCREHGFFDEKPGKSLSFQVKSSG